MFCCILTLLTAGIANEVNFLTDYHIFSIILMQRPVRLKDKRLIRSKFVNRRHWKSLPPEQLRELKEDIAILHDRVLDVMTSMPTRMFFILR
jgi:hypothetical protein